MPHGAAKLERWLLVDSAFIAACSWASHGLCAEWRLQVVQGGISCSSAHRVGSHPRSSRACTCLEACKRALGIVHMRHGQVQVLHKSGHHPLSLLQARRTELLIRLQKQG